MNKIIATSIATLFSAALFSQELPAPSPFAKTSNKVGLTDIEITYSRPSVKGREIFGGLVPFNEMWRTGANKATSISFSTDVKIQDKDLAAGTYAIFTIPGENEWEIIFNNNTEQWGTYDHKDAEDVLRVKVKAKSSEFVESMLIYVDDIKEESATVNLAWDKTTISIPVAVKVDVEAMKNIDKAIADLNGSFRVYNNSARYYLDHGKDAVKALEWAKKSVATEKKYWNVTTLSRAQAANSMYKEAIKTAEEAKKLAIEGKADSYVKTNEENIAAWKGKK